MNKLTKITNLKTGEVYDLEKATPAEISEALSEIIIKAKELKKIEQAVKKYILSKDIEFEESDTGTMTASYGIAKIRKSFRKSFDKKKFDDKASDYEKQIIDEAEKIKEGYLKLTEVTTFY